MRIPITMALIAATAISIPAQVWAADAIMAPAFDWSGAYAGLNLGYGWGNSTADYNDTGFPGFHANLDPNGVIGGGQLGYRYQSSAGIVLAPELAFNFAGMNGSGNLLSPTNTVVAGQSFDSEVDWTGSAVLKLGFAVDRFLPFVTGGASLSKYDVSNTVGGVTESAFNKEIFGWTIGGGAEYAVTDNFTAGVEYRYADYGRHHVNTSVFDDYHVDLSTQDVRLLLNYRF